MSVPCSISAVLRKMLMLDLCLVVKRLEHSVGFAVADCS